MHSTDVATQLQEGRLFFRRKYPYMKFLAYFQSFTNTHGRSLEALSELYAEAISPDDVVGLVVGTRPDTMPDEVVSLLSELNVIKPVIVELGAETGHDFTLRRINRGHKWHDTVSAVERCASAGLHTGLHLIAGLPGEDESDILDTVERCCELPIKSLKLHQLQVICDTPLAKMWLQKEFDPYIRDIKQYIDLCCRIIEKVPSHIAIERFLASSPPHMVLTPRWGLKNYEFTNLLLAECKNVFDNNINI